MYQKARALNIHEFLPNNFNAPPPFFFFFFFLYSAPLFFLFSHPKKTKISFIYRRVE